MITIVGEEGGYSCGSSLSVVQVTEFGDRQEFLPVILLIIAVGPEVLLEGGIGSFRLPICLRVECRAEVA